jgi:uncharacterized protein (DUF1015 family)
MTEVRAFAGYRYARDAQARIAPPYDVISGEERARYAREPENVVHVTLPPGVEGRRSYPTSARTFRSWIAEGVIVRDPEPRLYVLLERMPGGATRRGFFVLVRVTEYGAGGVFPHERTLDGPKRDRLLLTREVRANLEPVFFLYDDPEGALDGVFESVTATPSVLRTVGPDGAEIALFASPPSEPLRRLQSLLAGQSLVIADGHHRYETMLRYRDECRGSAGEDPEAPHEFTLGYLVNASDPATRLGAIHRLVGTPLGALREAAISAGFGEEPLSADTGALELLGAIARLRATDHAFALAEKAGAPCVLRRPRGADLDVEVLHRDLLAVGEAPTRFDADAERLFRAARAGEGVAIFLNPVSSQELLRTVRAGRLLPQKSTYFSPKVPSGLLFRDLE